MEDEFLLSGDVVSISGRNADDDKLLDLDDLTDQAYLDETAQGFGVALSADVRASPEGVPDLEDVAAIQLVGTVSTESVQGAQPGTTVTVTRPLTDSGTQVLVSLTCPESEVEEPGRVQARLLERLDALVLVEMPVADDAVPTDG